MRRFSKVIVAIMFLVVPSSLHAQYEQDLSDVLTSVFTLVGTAPPYTLTPSVPVDMQTCARAVHSHMLSVGWQITDGPQDASGATPSWPVIWQGCASLNVGGGGVGAIDLIGTVDAVIYIGTGFDGDPSAVNGTNAYVQAPNTLAACTVYAVGGLPYSSGAAANGGWAVARDDSGGGGGAEGYGAFGVFGGTGGLANGRCTSASAILIGGDSDTGNAGSASTDGGVGVDLLAIGGDTSGAGNGGAVNVTAPVGGNVDATGGSTTTPGNGGSVTTAGGATVGGNLTAVGGETTGAGNGGDITINAAVAATVSATCGSTTGAGNGGSFLAAGAVNITGALLATGGDSGSGTGGSVTAGALATGRVMGGASATAGNGDVGGNATVYCWNGCTVTAGDGTTTGGNATAYNDGGGDANANGGYGGTTGGNAIAYTEGGTRAGIAYTGGNAVAFAGDSSSAGTGGDATADSVANGVGSGYAEGKGGDCPSGGTGGSLPRVSGPTQGAVTNVMPNPSTPNLGAHVTRF